MGTPRRARQDVAREAAARTARGLEAGQGPARPIGDPARLERRPAGSPGAAAPRAHGRVALRLPARRRRGDGLGPVPHAERRTAGGHLRRRPCQQLRLLRHAAGRGRLRHQRLRRDDRRTVGVGPEAVDRERERARTRERADRAGAPGGGDAVRGRIPGQHAAPAVLGRVRPVVRAHRRGSRRHCGDRARLPEGRADVAEGAGGLRQGRRQGSPVQQSDAAREDGRSQRRRRLAVQGGPARAGPRRCGDARQGHRRAQRLRGHRRAGAPLHAAPLPRRRRRAPRGRRRQRRHTRPICHRCRRPCSTTAAGSPRDR